MEPDPAMSIRCFCKWPKPPRGCWARIGQASSCGTVRTGCWSAGPALGAPDGELRIPDDRGVVGQVVANRVAAARRCGDRSGIDRPSRGCATAIPNADVGLRAPSRPNRRIVRRVRADQQTCRQLLARRRRRARRVRCPCGRGVGKRPGPPAVAFGQPANRPRKPPKACA